MSAGSATAQGAEACDLYKNKIEENVAGIEEKALQHYAVTLEQAQKLGVSNQWTKLARQRANAYKPDTYPLTKDEHVAKQLILPGPVVTQDSSELGKLAKGSARGDTPGSTKTRLCSGSWRWPKTIITSVDAGAGDVVLLPGQARAVGSDRRNFADHRRQQCRRLRAAGILALAKETIESQRRQRLRKATELDPASGLAWHNLSAMYLLAKNYEQALFACERSTVLLPGLLATQLNLGSALRGMRRFIEADTAYKRSCPPSRRMPMRSITSDSVSGCNVDAGLLIQSANG